MNSRTLNIVLISVIVAMVVIGSLGLIVWRNRHNDAEINSNGTATTNTVVNTVTTTTNSITNSTGNSIANTSNNTSTAPVAAGLPTLVSSSPASGTTLQDAPAKVSVTFSRSLTDTSSLSVTFGDNVVNLGAVVFSSDGKTMEVGMNGGEKGTYRVVYTACSDKNSCNINAFEFDYAKSINNVKTPARKEM